MQGQKSFGGFRRDAAFASLLAGLQGLAPEAAPSIVPAPPRNPIGFLDWVTEHGRLEDGERLDLVQRPYLRELYQCTHPHIVLEKSAQTGISTWALLRCLWACDQLGLSVIYYFPTKTDCLNFSKTRVSPAIEASPYLAQLTEGALDNATSKRIGAGFVHFFGMVSNVQVKSTPADMVVFDELDEASPVQKAKALKRLNASLYKWKVELSNPTIPGLGIDVEFQRSDQRYWMVRCAACNRWGALEEDWPRNHDVVDGAHRLVCPGCKALLDVTEGEWVAKQPEVDDVRGYHLSSLMTPTCDLADLWRNYNSPDEYTRGEMLRLDLGIPHVGSDARLPIDTVIACRGIRSEVFSGKSCTMGVDVGKVLHYQISTRGPGPRRQVLRIGTAPDFESLDRLIRDYDVRRCVIDAQPEMHEVQKLQKRFPGRVFRCYYTDERGDDTWDKTEHKVSVNRTAAIDATRALFCVENPGIELPTSPHLQEYAAHCNALVRREQKNDKTGDVRSFYVRTGDDHWFHACLYDRLAWETFKTTFGIA